jgi:hypothetical protein
VLTHEEAYKRLAGFHKSREKEVLAEIAKLPEKIRTVGYTLHGRDASGVVPKKWEKQHELRQQFDSQLSALADADRKKLFAVLLPKLADHLEAAWQVFPRFSYEQGSDRRGFRAPNNPGAYAGVRANCLREIYESTRDYNPDVAWCAAWLPHISSYLSKQFGILFAAAIDKGDKTGTEVFEILKASATNEHEVGSMGAHVVYAMLCSAKPEAWEYIEKLLLAAQRQEGLRQVILEACDECHPEAFRRMLRLILSNNLLRFSSVVRAVDVWFDLNLDALTPAVVKKTVENMVQMFEDPAHRAEALANGKAQAVHHALFAIATEDVDQAVTHAVKLLSSADVERRYVAVHFIENAQLYEARTKLMPCLDDADLRIAVKALEVLPSPTETPPPGVPALPNLWDKISALLTRMPTKRQEGQPLVWEWETVEIDKEDVADALMQHRGNRTAAELLPLMPHLSSYARGNLVEQLAASKMDKTALREMLFGFVGDRDGWVRRKALEALKKHQINESEAKTLEALLTKKTSDLREGVMKLLVKQKAEAALASADRLLGAKKEPVRLGGLELLRALVEKKTAVKECRTRAEAYRGKFPKLTEDETNEIEIILDDPLTKPTRANALGLCDPNARSKPIAPQKRKVVLCTEAAIGILKGLDELVHEQRKTAIKITRYDGEHEMILQNVEYQFPSTEEDTPIEKDLARLPLADLWTKWYDKRPKTLKDKDGFELLRAMWWVDMDISSWKYHVKEYGKKWKDWLDFSINGQTPLKFRYGAIVRDLVNWLIRLHPPAGAMDLMMDVLETAYASVPEVELKRVVNFNDWQKRQQDWRMNSPMERWWSEIESYRVYFPDSWTQQHILRYWQLQHWRDQPYPEVPRVPPQFEYLVAGFKAGQANEHDVYDAILGESTQDSPLGQLTMPNSHYLHDCPALQPIVAKCVERVLEIELNRNTLDTAASELASSISSLQGLPTLVRLLKVLGNKPFARERYGTGRMQVLTHLIEVTHPRPEDTPELFAAEFKKLLPMLQWDKDRLIQFAFLAPQWVDHVERTLEWPGFKEAVYWFLVHTPGAKSGLGSYGTMDDYDFDDEDDDEMFDNIDEALDTIENESDNDSEQASTETPEAQTARQRRVVDPWERAIRERTTLTRTERSEGAVDAAWFHRVFEAVGRKRWDQIAEGNKLSGHSSKSYKKPILLADVLTGKAKRADLVNGIRNKKLKEPVRLLGLLPLPEGDKREAELLARYKVLVEYRRYARSLSSLARPGAERTAMLGLENLARTASYADPMRLEWAMEAKDIADLAAGPVAVTHEGVTVTLSINEEAQPEVVIQRGEKVLKALPAGLRKVEKISEVMERKGDLKRQASQANKSLEAMMVRGDTITGKELGELCIHPLLKPLITRLIIIGDKVKGYPVNNGQALEDFAGKVQPVKPEDKLRIAHCHDLFVGKDWDKWQADCFKKERVQPFKQVFREFYVVTESEKSKGSDSGNLSRRYAGQQVNPRQSMALFGSRGWETQDEIFKTFNDASAGPGGLVAEVQFRYMGWSPGQVEGNTFDTISFRRRNDYRALPMEQVPPRIFSEVMRDCDLVVSVAHVGGVDPEASASTVQMRLALIKEMCSFMKITNWQPKGDHHILIDGKLHQYSLHLGSGVVHKLPGGQVAIVPIHSQQRGRLFLPFADNDPRTAEVVSKLLLLAKDHEIQDPTILDQLR